MQHGKHNYSGFTIIELMVVLVIIALLVSVVPPLVNKSIGKAEEAALRENLSVMRKALDAYYSDNGQYPDELDKLVSEHYIRHIPVDPITKEQNNWQLIFNDDQQIVDIKSSSSEEARDGSYYHDW